MKTPNTLRWLIVGAFSLAVLQFVRPSIPSKPPASELQAPPQIKRVLEKGCYSCHSDQTRLAWFDEFIPAYWLVRHDVLTARAHLNFSDLGSKPPAVQKAKLFEAVNMIQMGAMPLPAYSRLHPKARLNIEDVAILKDYLNPWGSDGSQRAMQTGDAKDGESSNSLFFTAARPTDFADNAQAEFNGLTFDRSLADWKLISTTDRGDNNTLRLVLGNDVAIRAAESGHVSPWPDGTRFAKIAWKKTAGSDGLVHPGDFVQTELMVKDSRRSKSTDGWSWGRWIGQNLKPWGSDAQFVQECTGCHEPVHGNDFVYTLPITKAVVSGNEVVNNRSAALGSNVPYRPLMWNVITLYVNERAHTTAVLFGNQKAMKAVRASQSNQHPAPAYDAGSVLALITWDQRDDPHWFGARIPDFPRSIEIVEIAERGTKSQYTRYAGSGLVVGGLSAKSQMERSLFVQQLLPVSLP